MPERDLRPSNSGLRFGTISGSAVHICVDMQLMFQEETPWRMPWMERVLPCVQEIVHRHADRTIFTRFITAEHAGDGPGAWSRYWTKWAAMTQDQLDPALLDLIPDLARFCPPAQVIDKRVNSPWRTPELPHALQTRKCDTVVVTGGETDVCVLATVLGAVDRGYRVIVVTDALCSSADETHEAVLTVYASRYGQQIETVTTIEVLNAWKRSPG
jgi:nicotinamidase-related amidase